MGASESRNPKDQAQRTPVVLRARQQPKPQQTQAEKLKAAEKNIYEMMQEVVTYFNTQPISTLQHAQTAKFVSPSSCLMCVFIFVRL